MKRLFILPVVCLILLGFKQDKPAYRLFSGSGKATTYKELLKDAQEADIIFFGELHDVSVCHWLQAELTKDLYKTKGKNLILGAEMFESDNQVIVNEYLAGLIKDKNFEAEARLWPNYKTDYKPLLTFARDSSLKFIATNIPRRYASMVNKSGFEVLATLDKEAQRYFPPLPIAYDPELACYKDIMKSMGDAPSHTTMNIAKAQAVKDATMAYFIGLHHSPGSTFLHFNGTYHSDHYEGIVWYLKQAKPGLKILTISTAEQKELDELSPDHLSKGDYLLIIPESMNRTQ